MDYLAVVPHLPESDTKIDMLDFAIQGGGPAATAAVAAARLGARTAYIGQIGDDDFGDFMLREFEREKVDTSRVIRQPGARSQFSFVMVEKSSGKRTIVWTRSQVPPIDPGQLDRDFIASCKVLHVDRHEVSAAKVAAAWTREAGGIVSMDAGTYKPEVEELLPLVDVLITSQAFARQATGETYLARCAKALLRGRGAVGVTCGDEGSWFATGEDEFHVPAFAVDVVDTTGAGDVFHGAFAYGLAQGWDAHRCALFSSAVAALKCTKLGGRAGIPTREQAEALADN